MPRSRKHPDVPGGTPAEPAAPLMHMAARVEDRYHEWREQRGRKRGLKTTIIPYTGYGAPGWVRVLCRVVLTRGEEAMPGDLPPNSGYTYASDYTLDEAQDHRRRHLLSDRIKWLPRGRRHLAPAGQHAGASRHQQDTQRNISNVE